MITYKLTTNSFYPHVRNLGASGKIEVVVENDKIIVEGFEFTFVDDKIPNGETVLFWMGNWGYCYIKSEYNDYCKHKIESENLIKLQGINLKNLRRKVANEFYDSFNFPFRFHTNIKDVLSGLREGSNGCGSKKNTVYHTILDEDFIDGRFKRNKNEYLCSQPKVISNWAGVRHKQSWVTDGDGNCKSCLKILSKYKNK